jgi:hypothetical protein
MLLADRGIRVDQAVVASGFTMPSLAEDVAARLRELSGATWKGGALAQGIPVSWELIEQLSGSFGTFAALLQPNGPVAVGHWVVVDGITSDGLVLVRDPIGAAYGVPLGDFAVVWSYTILVLEQETA